MDLLLIDRAQHLRLIEREHKPGQKRLMSLRAMYNRLGMSKKALKMYDGPNPFAGVDLQEEEGKLRFLSRDEADRLLNACDEPLRTIVLLGLYTGLRIQSEALTLRWRDIDFMRGKVTVSAAYAKNKEMRAVPLNSILLDALRQLKDSSAKSELDDAVFLNRDDQPYRSIRTAFATACRQAGLTKVTPHVLRHTFASCLTLQKQDVSSIQELGGWKTIAMVERYAHVNDEHLVAAVEDLANPPQKEEDYSRRFSRRSKASAS